MVKTKRILAVLAVLAMAGSVAALAGDGSRAGLTKPVVYSGQGLEKTLSSRAARLPGGDGPPVALPTPVDPSAAAGAIASSKSGPLSTGSMSFDPGAGTGGLLTPRGGAMSTPKQRADREIRKLIRRLD